MLNEGSHGTLTALWGCSAGHAYHWPLNTTCKKGNRERNQESRSINTDSMIQAVAVMQNTSKRFLGSAAKNKGDFSQIHDSCDISNCSEPSEMDDNGEEYNSHLYDIVCESSATDEDGDSEFNHTSSVTHRKRTGKGAGTEDSTDPASKKIKQERGEDYYSVANPQMPSSSDGSCSTGGVTQSPKPNVQNRPSSRSSMSQKPSSVDGDSMAVSSSPLDSSPSSMIKPLRAPFHVTQNKMQVNSNPACSQSLATLPHSGRIDSMGVLHRDEQEAHIRLSPPFLKRALCLTHQPSSTPLRNNTFFDMKTLPSSLSADMDERAYQEQNEKTIRSTQTALRNFRDFLVSKYPTETREIYFIPCQELDIYLASFFVDARQRDGSEYEPNSLANYQCGLERYLKEHHYAYSITRDQEFQRSQDALKQKQLELKFKGKGNKPHKSMKLTFADELLLRKRGLLSRFNPEGLLNLVWLNNTKAFGHCTGFHSSTLKWGDVRLLTTETGLECLEWTYQDFNDPNARNRRSTTEYRIYATPHAPQTCPVQDYKEYAQRRPQAMLFEDAPFYLSIKPVVNLAALHWYNCQALGKNKLAKMVKTMCEKGNIPGRKTNFSVYQSCSSLSEAQSNQLVLICNDLRQQAVQSGSSHPGSTNFVIAGSFDSTDSA
uniref:Si:ch211-126i22.5 n=1 Tax=Sinocyclocheilus rhinocerous TaxID=307959 RepID=A0A673MQJ6_9TELE